jgi:hypothetical protein
MLQCYHYWPKSQSIYVMRDKLYGTYCFVQNYNHKMPTEFNNPLIHTFAFSTKFLNAFWFYIYIFIYIYICKKALLFFFSRLFLTHTNFYTIAFHRSIIIIISLGLFYVLLLNIRPYFIVNKDSNRNTNWKIFLDYVIPSPKTRWKK